MGKRIEEHSFSIEINQKSAVRKMAFVEGENDQIFFEGFLGKLKNVSMIEGVMLEIEGTQGLLKLDIEQSEIEKCLQKSHSGGAQ